MDANSISQDKKVAIYELAGGRDKARLERMLELYARLLPRYAHYTAFMRHEALQRPDADSRFVVHYWLVEVDGKPVGMTSFRYVPARGCGLGHSLAVVPECRKMLVDNERRLSVYIIDSIVRQVQADAHAAGDPEPVGLVVEVEIGMLMEHYKRYGFIEFPINYYEPIFPVDGKTHSQEVRLDRLEFHPMHLGLFPVAGREVDPADHDLLTKAVLAFLVDHYRLPADHDFVKDVLASI